jgi:hypothetical protein
MVKSNFKVEGLLRAQIRGEYTEMKSGLRLFPKGEEIRFFEVGINSIVTSAAYDLVSAPNLTARKNFSDIEASGARQSGDLCTRSARTEVVDYVL